jgi:hypothetical protein
VEVDEGSRRRAAADFARQFRQPAVDGSGRAGGHRGVWRLLNFYTNAYARRGLFLTAALYAAFFAVFDYFRLELATGCLRYRHGRRDQLQKRRT